MLEVTNVVRNAVLPRILLSETVSSHSLRVAPLSASPRLFA